MMYNRQGNMFEQKILKIHTKHCLRKPIIITLFSKIFNKMLRHQSDSMCELGTASKKSQIFNILLKKKKPKSQTIFFDANNL